MATIKISEMPSATTFGDDDYAMIVQSNNNKKITKTNLFSDIEEEISDIGEEITTLKNGEVYSTSEIKTNRVWKDGKSIYRNYFTGTFTSSSSSRVSVQLLENVDTLVDSYGLYAPANLTPNISIGHPMIGVTGSIDANSSVWKISSNNTVVIGFITIPAYDNQTGSYEIVIEYTKTTD